MTRSRLIKIWFALVVFGVAAALVSGASITVTTALILVPLALAPVLLLLQLWPGVQPPTASEVMHGTDRTT